MNRLESGEPREVIIYQIICDGVYRHNLALRFLSENGEFDSDASVIDYFDTISENIDALNDAYQEAQHSSCPEMKEVIPALDAYFAIFDKILEDSIFPCKLTDAEITALSADAGQALLSAQDSGRRCAEHLQNPSEKT